MHNSNKHHPAKFWESLGDKFLCLLCPHQCTLSEGQSGLCMVRSVVNGEFVTSVYGYPAAMHVDPIEKKPLYHFLPGTNSFSVGTQGCNIKCKFCQNWHLSTQIGHIVDYVTPENIVQEALTSECSSISLTYNDPIVFAEYAMDIRDKAKEHALPCTYITNGYITPQAREEVFKDIKAVNIDLKAFSNSIHLKYTGAKLAPILDTIKWCIKNNIHTEITNLIIPGVNDDEQILKKQCQWISKNCGSDIALHINAFHPDHQMKDYPRTSRQILKKCSNIAKECGLNYVYVGNYPGFDNNSYCDECHELIVKRDAYEVNIYNHDKHKLPIIWSVL